jgi:RNA polymerase II subunit A-like phosphatase
MHFQQAREIGREDENRLLKTKKLVLLVDLDQTLIHTTNDSIPAKVKIPSTVFVMY